MSLFECECPQVSQSMAAVPDSCPLHHPLPVQISSHYFWELLMFYVCSRQLCSSLSLIPVPVVAALQAKAVLLGRATWWGLIPLSSDNAFVVYIIPIYVGW